MRIIFLLLMLSILVGPLFANNAVTYLIYRSSFTNSQIETMKGYGYAKNKQPSKITEYIQAPNTNYARITISTTTNTQNNAIQSFLSQGRIQPLSTLYLKTEYDGRVGGSVSWVEIEDYKSAPLEYIGYPLDWHKDWTKVEVSSQ